VPQRTSVVAAAAAAGPRVGPVWQAAAVLATLLVSTLLAPAWTPGVRAADAFAGSRRGTVAFAVRTEKRLWGRDLDRAFPSASVVKALLMTAYLRDGRVRDRALGAGDRRLLAPMIRWSNNAAASAIVVRLGPARIERIARRSGMPSFHLASPWGHSPITAREQTRFMLHLEQQLPPRHRAYALRLLRTIVPTQRWGLAQVVPRGWTLYFKGGWGSGRGRVHHQVGLLRRGRERVALAVLSVAQGSRLYGERTLRGVALRLLRGIGATAGVSPRA